MAEIAFDKTPMVETAKLQRLGEVSSKLQLH